MAEAFETDVIHARHELLNLRNKEAKMLRDCGHKFATDVEEWADKLIKK